MTAGDHRATGPGFDGRSRLKVPAPTICRAVRCDRRLRLELDRSRQLRPVRRHHARRRRTRRALRQPQRDSARTASPPDGGQIWDCNGGTNQNREAVALAPASVGATAVSLTLTGAAPAHSRGQPSPAPPASTRLARQRECRPPGADGCWRTSRAPTRARRPVRPPPKRLCSCPVPGYPRGVLPLPAPQEIGPDQRRVPRVACGDRLPLIAGRFVGRAGYVGQVSAAGGSPAA